MEEGALSCSENQPHSCSLCSRCQSSSPGSVCMCSFGRHSDSRNGCKHLMITLGLLVKLCIIYTCSNMWHFSALVSSSFSLWYRELSSLLWNCGCRMVWKVLSICPSRPDPLSALGLLALCPRRQTLMNGINQLHCPVASCWVRPKGNTAPSSWLFRPWDGTQLPPVLPHSLSVPLTLPTSFSIIPSLNWLQLDSAWVCHLFPARP